MSTARLLAEFLTSTRYEDIPPKAIDYAAMVIASTVASAAMGSTLESSKIVRAFELSRGGTSEATVWFGGGKLPIAAAARVNALTSDAAASDDSDLRNIVHSGTTLAATAVAVAEQTGAGGKDILSAIALGYDIAGRINGAVIPGLMWEKGFHGSMVAVFGGAAVAARLLKLPVQQAAQALALAATAHAALIAPSDTSVAREYYAGNAARMGVESAQLAGLGFATEETALEQDWGYFDVYGQDARASGRVADVTRDLGKEWQILKHLGIKLVPGAHSFHSIAQAAADAARKSDLPASEVTKIVITRPNTKTFRGPRHPTDLVGSAHSYIYSAAAAVADRNFTWEHAKQEKIMDPRIRRLLDLVEVGEPVTEDIARYVHGTKVTVFVRDGRSFTSIVYAPRGSAVVGIEWADLEGKYRALIPFGGLSPEAIDKGVGVLRSFRDVKNVREFVECLR